MSVSVETDLSSPLSEGQSGTSDRVSKSSSDNQSLSKIEGNVADDENKDLQSEPTTPKPHPMAFTVDFGSAKQVDNRRLEELAKKSQARHQRVQSMSASLTRPLPAVQKPPMSAKLPRKAQGYNSEGYFSSDQEDSGLSGSVKIRPIPFTQSTHATSPTINRHIKSPVDLIQPKRTSKSPIVDNIMSRSDNFTSRQALNLPLKNPTSSYIRDVHRSPSYGNLTSSYHKQMADIIDQSPEGLMLTDISSPELDILTPDNGLSTPEPTKSPLTRKCRASSETPDLFKKCVPKLDPLYIDDEVDRASNNSSTGTYTIEGDNYTEEQKAKMSIDRTFDTHYLDDAIDDRLKKCSVSNKRDPEIIFDFQNPRVITKEPRRDVALRSPLSSNTTFDIPSKVSKDKNVLEISCCYESPTENDLAAQTSKQIKSTRSYLEKIKNRVRTITEKTFPKSPPKHEDADVGSFTSVTTSGVLSSNKPQKIEMPVRRRYSLAKSEIDQTDYVHRLSREASVPVSLPSNRPLPFDTTKFESTALKNAQKLLREDPGVTSDVAPEQVVGKLSYLSLNRCKGDKTWIQDWAESVKKYNHNTLTDDLNTTFVVDGDRPPLSPRHLPNPRSPLGGTPTKIPSPVGTLLRRRTPDLIPTQDTELYLQKTQNAISNLQAKLQSSRTNNFSNIPSQLTSSLISEKTAASRLPVSQLSRSNSLNYRLRRKENVDSSPLRSPGHYVITGTRLPESTRILLNSASRSLDQERRRDRDSNMNSPSSERGLLSNSSDDKTISNRPQYDVETILSPHRKTHVRHKSFDGRNSNDILVNDVSNANHTVCLKTVLKNNALEAGYPRIDQTRCLETKKHQRVFSDGKPKPAFGSSIKRSSSFSTVNRNNNYIDPRTTRRQSNHSEEYKDDYLSDESDNASFDKSQEIRYKRVAPRGRIDSPDLKSIAPANSPRCPNTPELQRKFGPGLVRNSVRVTNKERAVNTRMSEPPIGKEERGRPTSHQSRRISEPTRQAVLNRLTKSRSSTREFQPKSQEKGQKKPAQYRSSSALATKEIEFSNWKKRSSYDPMKAAQEGRRRQQAKRQDCKDDLSSPSHSSPVHRSQSFHTTNIADLDTLEYSSSDEQPALPSDPLATSIHSDILDLRSKDTRETLRRQAVANEVVLARDYVTHFQINQPEKKRSRDVDKRKTFIIDDVTPTKENVDFLPRREDAIDKRKTFILDSDSTTNGSSPRNSSIFSHEKTSLTTGTSDTEGESGPESAPVVMRQHSARAPHAGPASAKHRYSGDYSMSSSTTSSKRVQPRYLDISKYKGDSSKNFLRRDPSKTYCNLAEPKTVSKGSAQHLEMEQKKQELEKWKRRASYDPRKAAALGKAKPAPKTASSVLRSQSFHGPVLVSTSLRYQPTPTQINETYDASSDNDF